MTIDKLQSQVIIDSVPPSLIGPTGQVDSVKGANWLNQFTSEDVFCNVFDSDVRAVSGALLRLLPYGSSVGPALALSKDGSMAVTGDVASAISRAPLFYTLAVSAYGTQETIIVGLALRVLRDHRQPALSRILSVMSSLFGVTADGNLRWPNGVPGLMEVPPFAQAVDREASKILAIHGLQ